MGRVHKKKIAEYAEAENNNKDSASVNENERKKSTSVRSTNDTPELESDEVETTKHDNGKRTTKRKASESNESGNEADNGSTKNARNSGKAKQSQKNKADTSARGKEKAVKETPVEEEEEEEGDAEEYEVQKIIDHKVENGENFYLVRWKGYSENDDTWEPESTLSCPDLIAKFNKKQNGAEPNSAKKQNSKGSKKGRKSGGKAKDNVDATKEYEVDKIINYAEEKGGRLFLIRWKGYSAKHDTWEPESNLNCSEIIEKFMQKMQSQQNATFKELREEPKKTKRLVNETTPRAVYNNSNNRSSKRNLKKRVYYGDSDN